MKERIRFLSIINVIGLSIASISLILYVWMKPFVWSELFIIVNLLTSIPFISAGITILKNIENPNGKKIQNTLIIVFTSLWLPSIGLPFVYEFGGLAICVSILLLGLWCILKLQNPLHKMIFLTIIGLFFLVLNILVVFGIISEKL